MADKMFPHPGWENLVLAEANDRRARDRLMASQANEVLARRVANLAGYYPQLSPGVLTGAALAGLEPDDPRMMDLMRRQLALSYQAPRTPASENPLLRGLKGVSRAVLTLFDALYKETTVGTASFITGLAQGMSFEEAAERSYGFSGGAIAVASLLQGRPVSLGTGWMPNSAGTDMSPETQAALAQGLPLEQAMINPQQLAMGLPTFAFGETLRQNQGVKVEGNFPVTPGRLVASAFTDPNNEPWEPRRDAFSWVSGLVDFGSNLFLDPANLLLAGVGKVRQSVNALTPAIAPGGLRPTVLARPFNEFLSSGRGAAFSEGMAELARRGEYSTIYGLLHRSGNAGPPDPALFAALSDADEPARVIDVLTRAFTEGTGPPRALMPQTLTARALGLPSASVSSGILGGLTGNRLLSTGGIRLSMRRGHQAGFLARMAAEVGTRSIDVNRPGQAVYTLGEYLKLARFPEDRLGYWMHRLASDFDPDQPYESAFAVLRGAMNEWTSRLQAEGYSFDAAKVVTRLFLDQEDFRKYWLDAAGRPQWHPLGGYRFFANGEMHVLPRAQLLSEYLQRNIPLPNIQATRAAMRRVQLAQRTGGHVRLTMPDFDDYSPNVIQMLGESFTAKIWKPMVLLRMAWPVRVIGEEQIRMGADGLASTFHHPVQYVGWVTGRHGAPDLLGEPMEMALEHQTTMAKGAGAYLDGFQGKPYSDDWLRVEKGIDARFGDGAAIQYEQLVNSDLAVELARLGPPTRIPLEQGPVPAFPGGPPLYHGGIIPESGLGDLYHGQSSSNLVGPGLYSSSSAGIGGGYAGHFRHEYGRAGELYDVFWLGDDAPRILDIEAPAPTEVRQVFSDMAEAVLGRDPGGGGWFWSDTDAFGVRDPIFDVIWDPAKTPGDLYKEFGEALDVAFPRAPSGFRRGAGGQLDQPLPMRPSTIGRDLDDVFRAINMTLAEWYDALRYDGGIRMGGGELHDAYNWINLSQVRATPTRPVLRASDDLDDLVQRYLTGDLADLRERVRRDNNPDMSLARPDIVRQHVESVWARLHGATGGEYLWRNPELEFIDPTSALPHRLGAGTEWKDMWGNLVAPENLPPEAIHALPHHAFVITRPGNPQLIEGIATGNLDGINLLGMHPSSPRRFRQLIDHLTTNYWDSLPQFAKVARPRPRTIGSVWDGAVRTMFGFLMSKPTNFLSRSPAFRQFYYKRVGQLLPAMSDELRLAVVEAAGEAGITRTGLTGFVARLYQPTDAQTLRALHDLAGDFVRLESRTAATGLQFLPDALKKMDEDELVNWLSESFNIAGTIRRATPEQMGLFAEAERLRAQQFDGLMDQLGLDPLADFDFDATMTAIYGDATLRNIDQVDQMAKAFALEETRRLLYDASERHNFFDINRVMFPFGEAWYEIISTWGRLIGENPGILRRAQQGIAGARQSGFFYTDPDTGDEVFNYPGLGLLSNWMFGEGVPGEPHAAPTFTGRVQGLNLALGGFMPGFGPLLQLPASFFTPLTTSPDPRWKFLREAVLPYGPTAQEPNAGAIVDSFMPAWFKKGLTAVLGPAAGGDQARLLANTTMNVFAAMLQNGEIEDTPEGHALGLEKARVQAQQIFLIRSLAQFAGPTGAGVRFDISYDPDADPDGDAYSFQVLATAWREMLDENGGDEYQTFLQFRQTFGLDPTAIVTAKSKQVRARAVTEQGLEAQRANARLFELFPYTAYYAFPDDPNGAFDYGAYLGQLQSGDRVPLTPAEWLSQRNRLLGEIAYTHAKQAVLDSEGQVRTDDAARVWLRVIKDQLVRAYPGFGFDTPGVEAGVTAAQLRIEFENWLSNDELMATDAGRGLSVYIGARESAVRRAAELGVTEQGLATAQAAAPLRVWLAQVAQWIALHTGPDGGVNPDFVALWDRAYSGEVEDEQTTGSLELLGETFPIGP